MKIENREAKDWEYREEGRIQINKMQLLTTGDASIDGRQRPKRQKRRVKKRACAGRRRGRPFIRARVPVPCMLLTQRDKGAVTVSLHRNEKEMKKKKKEKGTSPKQAIQNNSALPDAAAANHR